jgi:hypothetical protein
MIDSDQGWESKAVVDMLRLDKMVLTGAVPGRKAEETYALKIKTNEDRTPKVNDEGLIECSSNGVAFGMMKREVFDLLKTEKYSRHEVYPYFQHKYTETDHYGEDTYFINECKQIMNVWIYPDITFTHGPITANYHDFLCRQPGGSDTNEINLLTTNSEVDKVINRMKTLTNSLKEAV